MPAPSVPVLAVLAALQGATEALPVSRSGHLVVARLWLDAGSSGAAFEAILHAGTALGLVVVARRRLLGALGEGVRAVARPTLFRGSPSVLDAAVIMIGTMVSLMVSAVTLPRVEMWSESPAATGVGLCVTGLALASTAMMPRPSSQLKLRTSGRSLAGAALVGAAHGISVFPGASRVGSALALLLWMGVKPHRAIDLAFLLTVPSLLVAFAHGAGRASGLEASAIVLGLVLSFLGVAIASEVLRALVERRRVGALALWTIPLGLAMLAYARALPAAS